MFFHIDLDCFYCSAERIGNQKLLGIPIAVGGRSDLKLFDHNCSSIRLMDKNQGSFVAPVFYKEEKKSFKDAFVEKKMVKM